MAREVVEVVATGVAQATFDAHAHNYRKVTRIGTDDKNDWSSPIWIDVVDNADSIAVEGGSLDAAGAGITVATSPTSTPV